MPERDTVLVTGASSGIGLELARIFAAEGHDLVLVARREKRLGEIAADLEREHGVSATVRVADLLRPGAPAEIRAFTDERGIRVDVLVNNAGFGAYGRFAELEREPQLDMMRLNMTALADLSRLYVGGMLERGRGGILNVASTAAFQPGPLSAVYFATKAFVLSFSEALAAECKGTGVTVTALCPGPTRTEFLHLGDFPGSPVVEKSMMDARPVAVAGYRGFRRGKAIVIPGLKNRWLARTVQLLPRAMVRNTFARIMEKLGRD